MTQHDLYVSMRGNDANPGTGDLPFRTITAAQKAARRIPGPVIVEVREGVYDETLIFTEEDSGDTYLTREKAVLTGGECFLWEETEDIPEAVKACLTPEAAGRVRMIDLKKHGIDPELYRELYEIGEYSTGEKYDGVSRGWNLEVFENGRRMTLARYPNEGYLQLEAVADVGDIAEFPPQNYWTGWNGRRNHRPGMYIIDKNTNERVKKWKHPETAWMFGYFYWDWADSSTPVRLYPENRAAVPGFVSKYGAQAGAQYYFYNVLDELDSPGEFYLDREEGLLYVYPRGKAEPYFDISLRKDPLIEVRGADHMTFSGFHLTNVRNTAIVAAGSANRFEKLTIRNAAVHGISVSGYRNLVTECDIAHTGCGGIYVEGGERRTLTHGENIVQNNRIHEFSEVYQTYQAGVSLTGAGNICAHNEISGSPHLAIYYKGNEHLIEYNDIHDVVLHSDDAGAIYSGYDWAGHGTVIRYNRLENIGSEDFLPNGIYWDDGLSGQTAYGNVFINVRKCGILIGGGRDNRFTGNIIVGESVDPIFYDDRNREGFVCGGWAHASCDTPDAPHWRKLEEVPYREGIWKERYPSLARITTDFSDPDNPDFPVNPAGSVVRHNVIINSRMHLGMIHPSVYKYSRIGENYLYHSTDEAGFDRNSLRFKTPKEGVPVIDADKIGILCRDDNEEAV